MFEKILLAVDGSDHALRAAKFAGELARQMKSEKLRIVVSFEPIPPYLGEPNMQSAINARLEEAQGILRAAEQEVGSIPGEIHTELIEGSPAEAILARRDISESGRGSSMPIACLAISIGSMVIR